MAIGKNIKGITIEFNGDTTKLGRAINDIDKKSRSLDKELKEVNRALKFNPGNTELLAQKQQLLGQKVTDTKSRLEALRKAQAELDDDPSVDKTSQEYRELRREIITTESKLEHFEQQLKELNNIKFEQLGAKIKDVGDKMKTVGDGMSKYVTAPIVGAGAASVKAWQEVDNGLDIVTQKTGASGKALEEMQQSVKNLTQEIPTDFETAGAAVGEVNTRFGLTGQALEDLSGKFIKFAELNGTDVSTSIDEVQKAMTAYGLTADQAGDYLDVLNKVGQDTGVDMGTLTGSLVDNAASMKAMGFDADQAAFFIGQLEKSGVDSSAALGGLQKALVNGAKEGKSMDQVLSEVQDSIVNAGSDTEALAAATEIFGAKAAPKMAEALRSGSLDLDDLSNAATDANGNLENTFNETMGPADKFQLMLNSLKVTGYEVADTLFTSLGPAIEQFAGWLKDLAGKWAELNPQTQQFILKAAGLVAIIGPALSIIGRIMTGIGSLISIFPKIISGISMIGKAFNVLKGIMLANPWMLVAAAAVAAIVLIVKHWDAIKEFFINLWEKVKEIFSAGWTVIKAVALGVITGFVARIRAIFNGVKSFISSVFNAIKGVASRTWNAIKNAILRPIKTARDMIKKIIEKIKGFFHFKIHLPHIKLPHFRIHPRGWKLGDLLHGKIPSLGIDWYAKGGIFKSPSVIGVGEKGPEAVLPIEKLNAMLAAMADSIVNGISTTMALQGAGNGGEVKIVNYLYPNGPAMGEQTVKMYDQYKRILG